jgi:hypothetical protein
MAKHFFVGQRLAPQTNKNVGIFSGRVGHICPVLWRYGRFVDVLWRYGVMGQSIEVSVLWCYRVTPGPPCYGVMALHRRSS